MAQRGQEGAQGHTAIRRMKTKTGMRLYLGSSGVLGPLILFFSPPQKRKMFFSVDPQPDCPFGHEFHDFQLLLLLL